MKKRKLIKKLELNRETLRNITDEKAELINGAGLCRKLPTCVSCNWTFCDTGCMC